MNTDTQARIENVTQGLQKVIEGAKELTDRAIMAQRSLNQLNTDLKNQALQEELAKAEAAEVERLKAKYPQQYITVDPNAPLMERLFPSKAQPVPMPTITVNVPGTSPLVDPNAKPKNLTNEARALIQTGHSYERAVSKLQAKYPNHPADNVRRAVGRARDGR